MKIVSTKNLRYSCKDKCVFVINHFDEFTHIITRNLHDINIHQPTYFNDEITIGNGHRFMPTRFNQCLDVQINLNMNAIELERLQNLMSSMFNKNGNN